MDALVDGDDGTPRGGFSSRDGAPATADRRRMQTSVARLVDSYADVLSRMLSALTDDLTGAVADRSSGDARQEPVVVTGGPGSTCGAVLWVHNTGGGFVPELTLRLTDLWHPNGSRICAGSGAIEPNRLDGSTDTRRAAWVSVRVPDSAALGVYHGHVLADGLPGVAVALQLIVR